MSSLPFCSKPGTAPAGSGRRHIWSVVGTVAVMALLGGCSRTASPFTEMVPTVIVQEVQTANRFVEEWSGSVRAREGTSLAFATAGRIQGMPAEVGDTVAAGAILAELDQEPFQLQLQQAQAEADAATPALAEATRRRDAEERLWAANATSRAEYDAALSAFAAASGRADATRAALALARRDLRESRLVAPSAGRVAQRLAPVASMVAAGTPVFAFDPAGSPEVVLSVPAARVNTLFVGLEVSVVPRRDASAPGVAIGRITHIGQRSLAGAIHEVIVQLPEGAPVFPGEAVVARLPAPCDGAVQIPTTALQPSEQSGGGVLVLDPGHNIVHRRPVRFVATQGPNLIVTAGLQAGERIVVAGAGLLREGQTVQPQRRD